jgi:hypothetical protein
MAVFGAGSLLEFKQDDNTHKIYKVADRSVLLHAGATRDANTIAGRIGSDTSSADVRTRLDNVLVTLLAEKRNLQLGVLVGNHYDWDKLLASIGGAQSGPFFEIWQQIRKLDLGEMLLIAPENSTFAIHWLRPPDLGAKSDLPYASIGSGGIYGRAALTIQQYSKSARVSEAMFQVYSAKKAAEMVYGVGEPTDMAVLTRDRIIDVSSETIGLLEQLRIERSKYILTEQQSNNVRTSLGID